MLDTSERLELRRQECLADERSNQELVALYLQQMDSDEGSNTLSIIQFRGGEAELQCARDLLGIESEEERITGAHILGQLGVDKPVFLEESVDLLTALLEDPSEDVICAAAFALGHRNDPRAIEPLLRLMGHSNAEVREGVVAGLSQHEDERAIRGLIQLSQDRAAEVRDWATFGLALVASEMDSPELRQALAERAEDEDFETRGEALIGLAKCRHPRALELIKRELEGEFYGTWGVAAACELRDPGLYPLLEALYAQEKETCPNHFHDEFRDALAACRPD